MAAQNMESDIFLNNFIFLQCFLSAIISVMFLDGFTLRVHGFGGNLYNYSRLLPYPW